MRYHLGLAALILIGGIVGGWWFSRSAAAPTTPMGIRDSIAGGDAVVVSYTRAGNGTGAATTITFIKGKGWTWQQAGFGGSRGTTVIRASSHTLMAAAPGCYIAIPDDNAPDTPLVPGVNLVRDLSRAPQLKEEGAIYTYMAPGDSDEAQMKVSEDLGGIAVTHSYRATATLESNPQGAGSIQPGVYTVRRASPAEREAAISMLSTAKASPVATFTVRQRALAPGAAGTAGAIALVSPEGCPDALAVNPAALGPASSPIVFSMVNLQAVLGTPARLEGGKVVLTNVVVVHQPFEAATDVLLNEIQAGAVGAAPIREGLTFGLPPEPQFSQQAVMAIAGCQPKPWFPC